MYNVLIYRYRITKLFRSLSGNTFKQSAEMLRVLES